MPRTQQRPTASQTTEDRLAARRTEIQGGPPARTVFDLIKRMRPQLEAALPRSINADQFVRVVLTELQMNKGLADCSEQSLLGAMMLSAQLGLRPGAPLGLCYLVPYGDKVTFILGYKGMMELARRSGQITGLYAYARREHDLPRDKPWFGYGLEPFLYHTPADGERGEITHVYAVAKYRDGSEPQFVVLTTADVERYRRRSKAANSGPWVTDWEAMALKTAVRRLSTWLPQSEELNAALAVDERQIDSPVGSLTDLQIPEVANVTETEEDTRTDEQAQRPPEEEQRPPREGEESGEEKQEEAQDRSVTPRAEGAAVAQQSSELPLGGGE